MIKTSVENEFEAFVAEVGPGLTRALAGHLPLDLVPDAVAEAFAYAWQHWTSVQVRENPGALLFRVAQSRARRRRAGALPSPDPARVPYFEPRLGSAMRGLPVKQRSAVWLVHACGWSYAETAEAMGISTSAVGTHVARAMARLRQELGAITR